jgi:excisionase family DNA binding protein
LNWRIPAESGIFYHPFPNGGWYMPDEILTLPEVAQLLKVAEKTVYTMAQKGELPAFKVRGQWRFKRADLDLWIETQKATSREPGAESK